MQNNLQAIEQFISHDIYRKSTKVAFITYESTNHVSSLWICIEISWGFSSAAVPRRRPLEIIVSVHISILFSMENFYCSLLGHYCFLHSQAHKDYHWQGLLHSTLMLPLSPTFQIVLYLKQTKILKREKANWRHGLNINWMH